MKSPDEIKKALECCFYDSAQCADCPYYPVNCDRELVRDAREYIRQLEAERDAAVEHIKRLKRCADCKHATITLNGNITWVDCPKQDGRCSAKSLWEWRGVQKEE